MKVTRVEIRVRADKVGNNNTFKYIPANDKKFSDFLVIGSNSCFHVIKSGDGGFVDTEDYVMVYNIGAQCWGVVPADTKVIATVAEMTISG